LRRALLAALALAAAIASDAGAHGRSLSYSSWRLTNDGGVVRVRIPRLELTRFGLDPVSEPVAGQQVTQLLAEHVRLASHGVACPPAIDPVPVPGPDGWVVYEWTMRCPNPGAPVISSTLLLDVAPSHLHFARVELPDGAVREAVLSETETSFAVGGDATGAPGAVASAGTTLWGYVALGVTHIATGWDHIAFVLALVLLAAGLREVALLVTGFTIAHSVTLALAVLGVVHPNGAAVDALIGFSIALVAAENSWLLGGKPRSVPIATVAALLGLAVASLAGVGVVGAPALVGLALFSGCHFGLLARVDRPARLRAAVAFAFGLVHGFGFAGVLAEMELPADRLVPALFGFNVGVELGQLAVVALLWPLLRVLDRAGADRRWLPRTAEVGSAAICGLGIFWFVTRLFG
jgi:hypothetical protein